MAGLFIAPDLVIPEEELHERFVRASGPGGQNVNKVASAVQLRFDVGNSAALPPWVREALLAGGRLTTRGELVIIAQRFREQEKNRADARARLAEILRQAATPQKPRRATRPPRASKKRRVDAKKRRGLLKQDRKAPF